MNMKNRASFGRGRTPSFRRSHAAGAALVALLAGHAAHAQSIWSNAIGGNWGTALNWDNGNVPDNVGESAIILPPGPYTVFLDNNYSINFLTISHALARVDLQNNLFLGLAGGFDGAGTFTVNNAAGPNATYIRVLLSQEWKGSGKIVLNANAGNLDTAYIYFNGGGEVVTLASGKEIIGTGRIFVSVTNNGGIIADTFGRTLELLSYGKTNNNEIAAINGGILQVSGITIDQGSLGFFRAFTGSTVSFTNAVVNGGEIRTDAGGATTVGGTSRFNGVTTLGETSVLNNSQLQIGSGLTNAGEVFVNSGSDSNQTYIRAMDSQSLTGNGKITLRADSSNLDTAFLYYNGGGEILTQGPGHTIRGTGNIYVALNNNGLVDANMPGRILRLTSFGKTNNSSIAASLGMLEIDSTSITQTASGSISLSNAGGASLTFRNASISGGLIQSTGNTTSFSADNTLTDLAISGPARVVNNSQLRLAGSGTFHTGDLFVNDGSGPNATYIRVLQNHAISGTGRIVLQAHPSNLDTAYIFYNGGSEVLTQSSSHSIVGTGNIYASIANAGLVSANVAERTLQLLAFAKSNSGTMNALNGATLRIENISLTQSGAGVVRASGPGSTVRFNAASVSGGVIESVLSGSCEFTGNSVLQGVTFNGVGSVPNNNELRVDTDTFTNNGVLTINPTAGPNGTYLRIASSRTINGTGSIVLNADPGNLNTSYIMYGGGSEVLNQSASHTIRGTGNIYVSIENNGTVLADVPGRTLQFLGFTKTNNSLMRATSGGILQSFNVALTQSPSGLIKSDSGGKLVFQGTSLSGGTLQTASNAQSDAAQFVGSNTVESIIFSGATSVENNSELRIPAGGLVNNGILTINPTGGPNGTFLRALTSTTIGGTGTILLNSVGGNLNTAYLLYNNGSEALSIGSGQTIAGTGNIYVRTFNSGILAPGGNNGSSIGRLNLPAFRFTQSPTGIMAFEIGGPTPADFDQLTGGATLDLAGSLVPSLINGYDPVIGSTFDVIDGPAIVGEFASVAPRFAAQYFPNKVRVIYTGVACPADLNFDGLVDDADFVIFVPAYNILDCADPNMPPECPADMNRDGIVNDTDFVIFLSQYNELICPE